MPQQQKIKPHPKFGTVKLTGIEYIKFQREIFGRDGWTCRNPNCRSHKNLTIHHKRKRSKLRLDIPENCITLCIDCHDLVEAGLLDIKTGGLGE